MTRGMVLAWICMFAAVLAVSASKARAMEEAALEKLLRDLEEEDFADDKLNLVRTCASTNTFACSQAARILSKFDFADGKLKALSAVKDRIEDPENKHLLLATFDFDSDRKKASDILAGLKGAVPPPKGVAPVIAPLVVRHTGAWEKDALEGLVAQLRDESFADGKKRLLKLAVEGGPRGFTSRQVCRVLGAFDFDSDMVEAVRVIDSRILGMTAEEIVPILDGFSFAGDKLEVLEAVKDAITDAENKFVILKAFTFGPDKKKAREILASVKARSCIYGSVRSYRVVFVIDVSGSMAASFTTNRGRTLSRLQFVLRELRHVLSEQLGTKTSFNIVSFSSAVRLWKPTLVRAGGENLKDARTYLGRLGPSGATDIHGALARASALPNVDTIYFLTDGKPTAGAKKAPDAIVKDVLEWCGKKKITIHTVAFLMGNHSGDDKAESRSLMYRLAKATGGVYRALE